MPRSSRRPTKPWVLVVEDDPTLGRLIERTLTGKAEVVMAGGGRQALEAAAGMDFDAAACDISLPDMPGMDVIAVLRESGPRTGIVAMTGFVDVKTAVEAMKAGADDFLGKPFDPQVLWHVLNKARDSRAQRVEAANAMAYRALAYTDALTGARNRRFLDEALSLAVEEARRTGEPLSVAFLDIDNFKILNDLLGHTEGDAVLQHVAFALDQTVAAPGTFARFGGDEFAAVFPGLRKDEAAEVMARFRAHVASSQAGKTSRRIPMRLSCGIAELSPHQTPRDLLAAAEDAMYLEKSMAPALLTQQLIEANLSADDQVAGNVACLQALRGLVKAIDRRDSYTRLHSDHATRIALQMARRLGLSDEEVNAIALGGPLHDLGKIVVPDEILQKPGPLTAGERQMMDLHPVMGAAIAGAAMDYDAVVELVRHHHERFDGAGYPAGLRGTDISLTTRIFSLADAFSAMTTDRPYRVGLRPEAAHEQIRLGAGSQFDPDLAREFLAMLEQEAGPARKSA